jgi:hypothetical protein
MTFQIIMEPVLKKIFFIVLVLSRIITNAQSENKLQFEGEMFFRDINYGKTNYYGYYDPISPNFIANPKSFGIGGAISLGFKNWFLTVQESYIMTKIDHYVTTTDIYPGNAFESRTNSYRYKKLRHFETNLVLEKLIPVGEKIKFNIGIGTSIVFSKNNSEVSNDAFRDSTYSSAFLRYENLPIRFKGYIQAGILFPITNKLDCSIRYFNSYLSGAVNYMDKNNNEEYILNRYSYLLNSHTISLGLRYSFLNKKD